MTILHDDLTSHGGVGSQIQLGSAKSSFWVADSSMMDIRISATAGLGLSELNRVCKRDFQS